jgi:drug/metabolite transporter (DMT)-like permease
LAAGALAVAWGTIGVVVRWSGLPAASTSFARSVIAAVALGAFLTVRDRRLPWTIGFAPGQRRWVVAFGAALGLHWLFLLGAYQRAPIGVVLLITYLYPALVTAVAPRLLGEPVGGRQLAALGLSLAGVAVLAKPERGGGLGVVYALAACVLWAAIAVGIKRHVSHVDPLRVVSVELTAAAVVLAPFALASRWGPPRVEWLWLVVLGVVLTAGTLSAFTTLLRHLPVATVGIIGCIEPVAAVGFAWWALDERPTWRTALGGTAVLAAAIMVAFAPAPRATPELVTGAP